MTVQEIVSPDPDANSALVMAGHFRDLGQEGYRGAMRLWGGPVLPKSERKELGCGGVFCLVPWGTRGAVGREVSAISVGSVPLLDLDSEPP